MLTTFDIDAFKYWFGVKRCKISSRPWRLLAKAGLLPPPIYDNNPLIPKPIFEKEQLIRYYLANRRELRKERAKVKLDYENSMVKTDAQRAADRPSAPWL